MQVNFSPDEYKRLCRIADYYGTTPAWIVRRYVEEKAGLDEWLIERRLGGVGTQGEDGTPHPDSPPEAAHKEG